MPSPPVDPGVLVGEHVELAAARAHFLQVRLQLLEQRVVGRDRDHRHVAVDQRERPVLELAGGVGLGVDVGDLLQLQRAFHRDRVVDAAAEEQRVLAAWRSSPAHAHLRLDVQHVLQRGGQVAQRAQQFPLALARAAGRAASRARA